MAQIQHAYQQDVCEHNGIDFNNGWCKQFVKLTSIMASSHIETDEYTCNIAERHPLSTGPMILSNTALAAEWELPGSAVLP